MHVHHAGERRRATRAYGVACYEHRLLPHTYLPATNVTHHLGACQPTAACAHLYATALALLALYQRGIWPLRHWHFSRGTRWFVKRINVNMREQRAYRGACRGTVKRTRAFIVDGIACVGQRWTLFCFSAHLIDIRCHVCVATELT